MRRRRRPQPLTRTVHGVARVDRRTKDLAKRIGRGEIAVIDHRDVDRVAGESLVAAGVAGVVNANVSISGRYPNGGPIRIVQAGVPLMDVTDADVMQIVRDGDIVELRDGGLWRDGEKLVSGDLLLSEDIEQRMQDARRTIGNELRGFARNTLEFVEREADLTFEPLGLPPLRTRIGGRHVLVVVRGHDYKHDLKTLRPYINEFRPVLIAVDGGADALIDVGLRPDIIIGDFDSLSDRAWHCGADLVHHVHPDGRAPGRENLAESGLHYEEFVAEGTSEDVAMLLAYEAGATLIVAVGTHATMVEFLDKGRSGMASTFLTRLRLGPVLADAKGVSRLYEGRVRRRDMFLLVASALAAMIVMTLKSDSLRLFVDGARLWFQDLWHAVTGLF